MARKRGPSSQSHLPMPTSGFAKPLRERPPRRRPGRPEGHGSYLPLRSLLRSLSSVGHRVLEISETCLSFQPTIRAKYKSPPPEALAMGFSVPSVLNLQVSSFPAPVWAHVQQQEQHWQHICRERLISS